MSFFSPPKPPKLRASHGILLSLFLSLFLFYLLSVHPPSHSLFLTLRYPTCGHIILVSAQRHGSTWFISNAEGCTSTNGSFGRLNNKVEIWNHGKVRNITIPEALSLVEHTTSIKIMPDALYDFPQNVRRFLEETRVMHIPVFVLRRNVDDAWASLKAAKETKIWNADHGGSSAARVKYNGPKFLEYRKELFTFFKDVKKAMTDVGVVWDELNYERIMEQRVIIGKNARCVIRNCNF